MEKLYNSKMETEQNYYEIDWSKVKNLEDVITILKGMGISIQQNSSSYFYLIDYLKTPESQLPN